MTCDERAQRPPAVVVVTVVVGRHLCINDWAPSGGKKSGKAGPKKRLKLQAERGWGRLPATSTLQRAGYKHPGAAAAAAANASVVVHPRAPRALLLRASPHLPAPRARAPRTVLVHRPAPSSPLRRRRLPLHSKKTLLPPSFQAAPPNHDSDIPALANPHPGSSAMAAGADVNMSGDGEGAVGLSDEEDDAAPDFLICSCCLDLPPGRAASPSFYFQLNFSLPCLLSVHFQLTFSLPPAYLWLNFSSTAS